MSRSSLQTQIGAALRAARWSRGITQGELSQALGIDRSTFARYEAGGRPIPATVLIECAAHLNVSVDELLGRSGGDRSPAIVSDLADSSDVEIVTAILRQQPQLAAMVRELLETMPGLADSAENAAEGGDGRLV